MRITIVLGPFHPPPPGPAGAVEKAWWSLAREFTQSGHAVTVVASDHPDLPRAPEWDGIRVLRRPPLARSGRTSIDVVRDFFWSRQVAKVLPEAEVTVTNCVWLPWLLRRRSGSIRRRIGALNVHVQRYPKGQMGLYRGADRISTVSATISEAIAREVPELASRILVIPNPVDLSVFHPGIERPGTPRRLLYTGRIHPAKRLDLLVEAWRSLREAGRDLELRLVGPWAVGAGGGGDRLIEELRSLAAPHEFELPGPTASPLRLAEELRAADLYCYPSTDARGEALPVAPLEAMACGLVPVVADLGQYRGVIDDSRSGLVFSATASRAEAVAAIRSSLERLILEADWRRGLAKGALETARTLSTAAIAARHLSDFEQCHEALRRTP